jgi:hypothetical protein
MLGGMETVQRLSEAAARGAGVHGLDALLRPR